MPGSHLGPFRHEHNALSSDNSSCDESLVPPLHPAEPFTEINKLKISNTADVVSSCSCCAHNHRAQQKPSTSAGDHVDTKLTATVTTFTDNSDKDNCESGNGHVNRKSMISRTRKCFQQKPRSRTIPYRSLLANNQQLDRRGSRFLHPSQSSANLVNSQQRLHPPIVLSRANLRANSDSSVTTSVAYLQSMLRQRRRICRANGRMSEDVPIYSQIMSRLYLGGGQFATDIPGLKKLGVTHIVNAAQGSMFGQVPTNATYYNGCKIEFFGIPASDNLTFNMALYFQSAADFIESALKNRGTVYVHCRVGVSRSATIVIAYLMLKKEMSVLNAIQFVQTRRAISPNSNFLTQLCRLEKLIQNQIPSHPAPPPSQSRHHNCDLQVTGISDRPCRFTAVRRGFI